MTRRIEEPHYYRSVYIDAPDDMGRVTVVHRAGYLVVCDRVGPLLARLLPCESCGAQGGEQQRRGPKSFSTSIWAENPNTCTQREHMVPRAARRTAPGDSPRLLTCLRDEKSLKSGHFFVLLDQTHTAAPKMSCISAGAAVRKRDVDASWRDQRATARLSGAAFKSNSVHSELVAKQVLWVRGGRFLQQTCKQTL